MSSFREQGKLTFFENFDSHTHSIICIHCMLHVQLYLVFRDTKGTEISCDINRARTETLEGWQ